MNNDCKSHFESRGFSDDVVKEWHLEDNPSQEIAKINYLNIDGKFLYPRYNYYGEKYKDKIPKYISPKTSDLPEGHSWLYGLWKMKDLANIEYLLLVEGEYNCISAWIMGYVALGVPGQTIQLKDYHLKHIPANIKKIILLYDDIKFALQRADEIKDLFGDSIEVFIANYSENMDANDYLVQGKKADFADMIKKALKCKESKNTDVGISILKELYIETIDIPEGDFVTYYCDEYACKSTDSPKKYQELMALAVISVALNRKIYLPYSANNIYPNLYVVLIGKSTIMRKSVSLNLARSLIYDFNKDLILPNDFTQEGFFEHLKEFPKGIIVWSEFGGFLQKSTKSYMAGTKEFLTDAFDCPIYLNKKLAGKKIFEVENPYINIITATSMEWFIGNITEGDIKGGFLGRFVYIPALPSDKDKWFAFPPIPNQNVVNHLLVKLKRISELNGQMGLTEEAKDLCTKWLKNHEDELCKLSDDKGISGFYGRLADYILKFAILYEISSTSNLVISENSIKRAIRLVESLKESVKNVLEEHVSFTLYEKNKKRILSIIKDKKEISRSILLRALNLNKKDFDLVMDTLLEEETIKVKEGDSKYKPKTIYYIE